MNSLSSYLADAWRFFAANLVSIIAVLLPLLIPIQLAFAFAAGGAPDPEAAELSDTGFLVVFASLMLYPVYQGALICFIDSRVELTGGSIRSYYSVAMQLWMPMLAMYAMTLVAVAAVASVFALPGVAIFGGTAGIGLLVLPALYVFARLSYAEFYCLLEKRPAFESVVLSWRSTEEQQWMLVPGVSLVWTLTTLPVFLAQNAMPSLRDSASISGFLFAIAAGVFSSLLTIFRYRLYTQRPQ